MSNLYIARTTYIAIVITNNIIYSIGHLFRMQLLKVRYY